MLRSLLLLGSFPLIVGGLLVSRLGMERMPFLRFVGWGAVAALVMVPFAFGLGCVRDVRLSI